VQRLCQSRSAAAHTSHTDCYLLLLLLLQQRYRWRGGPMFWGDEIGLSSMKHQLEQYGARYSNVSHWKPAPLLTKLVAAGEDSLLQWHRKQQHSTRNSTNSVSKL
jgi:3-hydroxyacyl-CoA dehydrogenase